MNTHPAASPRTSLWRAMSIALALLTAAPFATAESDPALAQEVATKGWIVYSARADNSTWDLFLARPDGSAKRNITNTADYEEAAPRFSPDSKQLLFRRMKKGTVIDHDKWGFQGELVIANPDGSDARPLGPDGELSWASWSPDGTQLACLERDGVKIIDLATKNVIATAPRNGVFQQLFWSPDGKWFCGTGNVGGRMWSIVRMDTAGEAANPVRIFQNCTPDWFPDSKRIIFSSRPEGQKANDGYGWTQLWQADGDGGNASLIYGEEGFHIYGGALSPDAEYVIFTRCPKDGGGSESDGAPMAIMRLADAPAIRGESPELRANHPGAKDAPLVELLVGWEPHWTYAEVIH